MPFNQKKKKNVLNLISKTLTSCWKTKLRREEMFFLMNKNFIHNTKQNYKDDTTTSSLMIISKQGGPKPTSKDPKTLFKKDHLARE